jgi:hypothetical protein
LGGRIVGTQLDERTAEEVAAGGHPFAALPPPARLLLERYEPIAFMQLPIGNDVFIGRAGPFDDADSTQNNDPAARSASPPSGPISR